MSAVNLNGQDKVPYILGIDLGTNSLGWAAVKIGPHGPIGLLDGGLGVRVFQAGLDETGGLGNEESRNRARREARLRRRQVERRARRLRKVFRLLQSYDLLPPGPSSTGAERQKILNQLDSEIVHSKWFEEKVQSGRFPFAHQAVPYVLRTVALDEALPPFYLGRALFHLAQRRGFLSNRVGNEKNRQEQGQVRAAVQELAEKIQQSGARTLGEYLSRLNPAEQRLRGRYTSRSMYLREFDALWTAQARHHPATLTDDRKKQLYQAIFYQRPLWHDPDAVGKCSLEPDQKRAPAYHLAAQRFRMLQRVNDLVVIFPTGQRRQLNEDQRKRLLEELEYHGDLTFATLRRILELPRHTRFNLEEGGETRLPGNRTAAAFYEALGDDWLKLSEHDRQRLVEYVRAFEKPEKLPQAAARKWGFPPEKAQKLSEIVLEDGYLNVSLKAIEKLLPLMEQGIPYGEARKRLYPEQFQPENPVDRLPPVKEVFPDLRNPAVARSLTELRKVVNAIISRWGKPQEIRVELARELRKPKAAREALAKRQRENEKDRKRAEEELRNHGIQRPSSRDIQKYLLASECRWQCPYTGLSISWEKLFGPEPEFEIEHIIPFSRSLDNSFVNLTLCHVQENRQRKGNATPWEAYAGDPDRYREILDRVRQFTSPPAVRAEKLRRFQMDGEALQQFLDEFNNRQLNDTAYASRLAAEYLGRLYGGTVDAAGRRRVLVTGGQVTAFLRNGWQLHAVLGGDGEAGGEAGPKPRNDHRHHAVDALVVALTDQATIQQLSRAAQNVPVGRRKLFGSLEAPWSDFVDSVRQAVQTVITSHRVSRRVRGCLHDETHYAPPDAEGFTRVRKPLNKLSPEEIERIADPRIRELVKQKLAELGAQDPRRAFASPDNLPQLPTRSGSLIPIKRVRLRTSDRPVPVGNGPRTRYVLPSNNHHVEIYATRGPRGERWAGSVVSFLEAYERKRQNRPVVCRDHGPGTRFVFSLAPGEIVRLDREDGPEYWVVRSGSFSEANRRVEIALAPVNDARKKEELRQAGLFLRCGPDRLRAWKARKISLSPLGEPRSAHD